MEIILDGSSELLAHIESIKTKQFLDVLKNYDISDTKDLKYSFSFSENDVILSISDTKTDFCLAKGKAFLVGKVLNEKKYIFEKNESLDSVLGPTSPDEIIKEITKYKIAMDETPYFISVIIGAYMIGYGFDYVISINEKLWGIKDIQWTQQILGENLDIDIDQL